MVALLSNLAAGAQAVAVAWQLGDDSFPVSVLVLFQTSALVGGLLGIAIGSRLVDRLGVRRTVLVSSLLEAVVCAIVAGATITPAGGTLTLGQAFATAVAAGAGISFAAGTGGPSWVALVSRWPGTDDETGQLLRDNAQFQLGRFLGPILGGLVMAATLYPVQWLAAANALTFVAMAAILLAVPESRPHVRTPGASGTTAWLLLRHPALWAVGSLAVAADSARVFLPRLVRMADQPEVVYTTCVAVLAVTAAAGGVLGGRVSVSERTMAVWGLLGSAAGVLAWSLASGAGAMLWFVGAAVMGLSIATAAAALTTLLMRSQGEASRSRGAAFGMAARTVGGALGGVTGGVLLTALAGLAFLPLGRVSYVRSQVMMAARTTAPR
jgi:predicted MFS family arabinose efflux permease